MTHTIETRSRKVAARIAQLGNPDEGVRLQACVDLTELLPASLGYDVTSVDMGRTETIQEALSSEREIVKSALTALISCSQGDSSQRVRSAARKALSVFKDPAVWPYADLGEPFDWTGIPELVSQVPEPILAAGVFRRRIGLGCIPLLLGVVTGALILGVLDLIVKLFLSPAEARNVMTNLFILIPAFIFGFAIPVALAWMAKEWVQRRRGYPPAVFILAVTEDKLYALTDPPKVQVAVWPRSKVSARLVSSETALCEVWLRLPNVSEELQTELSYQEKGITRGCAQKAALLLLETTSMKTVAPSAGDGG